MASKTNFNEIHTALLKLLSPEVINGVSLPKDLLDARTADEISDRYFFIYHELFGPICVRLTEILKRNLSLAEIGFVSEKIEGYLKEQGF